MNPFTVVVLAAGAFLCWAIVYKILEYNSDDAAIGRCKALADKKQLTQKIILVATALNNQVSHPVSGFATESMGFYFVGRSFGDGSMIVRHSASVYRAEGSTTHLLYDQNGNHENQPNTYIPGEWEEVLERLIPAACRAQKLADATNRNSKKARFGR